MVRVGVAGCVTTAERPNLAGGDVSLSDNELRRRLDERLSFGSHPGPKRGDFDLDGRFSTFLWRVALNLCYDELRRRQRRAEFSLDELEAQDAAMLPDDEASPSARLEEQERGDFVRAALQRLPAHYRAVVVLRHYEGLKFREIADVLEIPEGTVKSRMAEALDHLAVLLKEFAPPAAHAQQPKQSICV